MNEPLENDAQGPGFLIIKLVSHITALRGKIQTLEKDLQGSRESESEARAKLAKISGAQVQQATESQKENVPGNEIKILKQIVIPALKLKNLWLTRKNQCDALDIQQLGHEKEQLSLDLTMTKNQACSPTESPVAIMRVSHLFLLPHFMVSSRCWK
jgi:hypothetical protein